MVKAWKNKVTNIDGNKNIGYVLNVYRVYFVHFIQYIVYLNELYLYTKMYMSLEAWARTISNRILRFNENTTRTR